MSILETIKSRRSIRAFKDKPIPEEIINQLVEAIIWAPSAGNLQSRKFYLIHNQDIKKSLVEAAWGQAFIAQAPLVLVGCINLQIKNHYGTRGTTLYGPQDVAASVQSLMLLAQSAGLGTVWTGAFNESAVTKILNLPDYLRPVAIVPVGYPDEKPEPPGRVSKKDALEVIE